VLDATGSRASRGHTKYAKSSMTIPQIGGLKQKGVGFTLFFCQACACARLMPALDAAGGSLTIESGCVERLEGRNAHE